MMNVMGSLSSRNSQYEREMIKEATKLQYRVLSAGWGTAPEEENVNVSGRGEKTSRA